MRYYSMLEDDDDDDAMSIDIQHLKVDGSWHDIWIYGRCETADSYVPFKFQSEEGELRDFNLTFNNIPLVSERFKRLLDPLVGSAVQFIGTELAGEKLFVLNVLERCDAMDLDNCIVTRRKRSGPSGEANAITGVINLRIDPARAAGRQIFRLEKWNIPIIVSEQIEQIAVKEGVTGVSFERVA